MGKAEKPEYAHGSWELARYLSDLTASSKEVVSVICGGDTVAVVDGMGSDQGRAALCFSHVSSGGGAALEFLQGDVLPGISVLPDR
jgi:phosphoglycerate kinase